MLAIVRVPRNNGKCKENSIKRRSPVFGHHWLHLCNKDPLKRIKLAKELCCSMTGDAKRLVDRTRQATNESRKMASGRGKSRKGIWLDREGSDWGWETSGREQKRMGKERGVGRKFALQFRSEKQIRCGIRSCERLDELTEPLMFPKWNFTWKQPTSLSPRLLRAYKDYAQRML